MPEEKTLLLKAAEPLKIASVSSDPKLEGKKEACKTYIEQTKLLVTLASAFLFAPAVLIPLLKDAVRIDSALATGLLVSEGAFVASIFLGYVVLGTVAGSQSDGTFNVYRFATRFYSLMQIVTYLCGMAWFAGLTGRFFGLW